MIADTLISDETWALAPEEPQRAFLFIAEAAYERLKFLERTPDAQGQHSFPDWRKQYVYELASVANELGISGVMDPETALQNSAHLDRFDAQLARVITGIEAAHRHELRTDSVNLSYQTKADIREHLETLRTKVSESNLSEKMKSALHAKINAVEAELDKGRSSLTPFWILAGSIGMAGCTALGALADLPEAIGVVNEIVELVHEDKAEEEKATQRLVQPLLESRKPLQITHQPETVRPKRSGKKAS